MGYSLYLLTATFLAAQGPDVTMAGGKEEIGKAPAAAAGACYENSCCRTRLLRGRSCCDSCCCQRERCGFLARLFARRCGDRCRLFSLLGRNGCCDHDGCDKAKCPAPAVQQQAPSEQKVLDACCRGRADLCCLTAACRRIRRWHTSCGAEQCARCGLIRGRCCHDDHCQNSCESGCHRCRLRDRFFQHGCNDCDGGCRRIGILARLRERLRCLFGRLCSCNRGACCAAPPAASPKTAQRTPESEKKAPVNLVKQAAPVAEPAPRRLPYVSKTIEAKPVSQPKKLSTPEVSTPELIPTPPAPVDTKTVPTVGMRSNSMGKTGHEADYSWITGELQKAEGIWVLRYASSNGKDNFGGYVMLFSEVDMRNFKEGDLVSVRGNIINASARGQQAAHYRASTVDLIER